MKPARCLPFLLGAALWSAAALPTAARPKLSKLSGTVTSFDRQTSQLNVNTQLGRKLFQLTATTLILLNNHTADTNSITPGDEVTVTFRFDTSEATIVHLFRQIRQKGTVVSASATAVSLALPEGAVLSLRTDDNSVVELEGIPLKDRAVLTNLRAKAVFEPGTFLLLSLQGDSLLRAGRLARVDNNLRTLNLRGRPRLTFTVDPIATILRDGVLADLENLVVSDRVRVAFVRDRGTLRVLAIEAFSRRSPRTRRRAR